MSSVNIKMKGDKSKEIKQLAGILKGEINAELVCDSRRSLDDVSVILLSFEKYYMRNGGYASLTVMLVESEDAQTADIIGSGGGEGIFNISWGANSEFAEMAERVLYRYGFSNDLKQKRLSQMRQSLL